jgi:hypothetical protein
MKTCDVCTQTPSFFVVISTAEMQQQQQLHTLWPARAAVEGRKRSML